MSEFDAWFRPRLRTMQIISLALPLGALLVVVVLALLRNANPQPLPQRPILSILFLGFWFVQMSLSLVIPGIVTKGALKQLLINPLQNADLRERLVGIFQTGQIVRLALIEGVTFFGAVAYFIEGQPWTLGPVALGLGWMVAQFPTERRVLNWLGNAGEQLQQFRENSPQ